MAKSLNDRSPTVRGLAVEIIGEKQIDSMLLDVLAMLNDSSSEVRTLAVESIGNLADRSRHVSILVNYLKDPHELVRVSVAEVLGEIGDITVLDNLDMTLNDKSSLVRGHAAEAIGALGQKKSIKILKTRLIKEKNERAKVGLFVGLHKLDEKNFLNDLLSLLKSEDYRVRCAVANSLSLLNLSFVENTHVVNSLKQALSKEETVAARSSIEGALADL